MNINSYIDYTLLKPTTTTIQFKQHCEEAVAHKFAAVCIPPFMVQKVAEWVAGTGVNVCTVIGFPFGYNTISVKTFEALNAIQLGAQEIDMVVNNSAIQSGALAYVEKEIALVTQAVHEKHTILKVIIETAYLNEQQLEQICKICVKAEVDYVKTSTGFANPKQETGAKLESIKQMRALMPNIMKIKASGGIKTTAFANELIALGVQRLGTSSGLEIIGVA